MHTKEAGASVSATTLYPFLSPPTRLARYYRKRRSSASNDRCNSHKRLVSKKTKKSSNQREIYPFPRSFPLSLRFTSFRYTLYGNRVLTSRKTRWFITLSPSKLISRLSTCRHHPTPCLSTLFLLALSAATHHSYTFLSSPLDRRPSFSFPCVPFITRRPCPTPTLTPGLFREHHLHNPPALPSRAACTFHRPYYFHR